MLDADLEAAARGFAARLAQTEPLAEFRKAQDELEADAEAQRLLIDWDQKQQELLARQRDGQTITSTEMEALRRLQDQIRNHPVIGAWLDKRRYAQFFLTDINAKISQILGVDFEGLSR